MSAESRHRSDPATAFTLSQMAPSLLAKPAPTSTFFPLSLLSAPETPELWTDTEALFLACLTSGDDKSAHLLLQRLKQRFGPLDERVMGLQGVYREAVAENDADLKVILAEYNSALADDPMNVVRQTPKSIETPD
jgi:ER membrane protein complex subunit 2